MSRVDALKQTHATWLAQLFAGPHDERYFDDRWRIGLVHVRVRVPETARVVVRPSDHEIVIDEAFRAFTLEQRRAEVGLDLEPGVAQLVALAREVAFRSGWGAAQRWQEGLDAAASTVRASVASTVHALVDLGDRAWVQPLAIIEHIPSGALFVDRFLHTVITEVTPELAELALAAVGSASHLTNTTLHYARVDALRLKDGTLALGELEITEPGLYLDVLPQNAQAFARMARDVG